MKQLLAPLITFGLFFPLSIGLTWADGENQTRGEEIWQKLSREEISCGEVSNEQFEALGDFLMERMMGSSHETMDKQMEQMMGKDGLRQMHIAMGKRMSDCEETAVTGGAWGGMMGMMMPMMGYLGSFQEGGGEMMMGPGMMGWGSGYGMMGQGGFWVWSVLAWITWILVVVALIAFIRWMWKKGEK